MMLVIIIVANLVGAAMSIEVDLTALDLTEFPTPTVMADGNDPLDILFLRYVHSRMGVDA